MTWSVLIDLFGSDNPRPPSEWELNTCECGKQPDYTSPTLLSPFPSRFSSLLSAGEGSTSLEGPYFARQQLPAARNLNLQVEAGVFWRWNFVAEGPLYWDCFPGSHAQQEYLEVLRPRCIRHLSRGTMPTLWFSLAPRSHQARGHLPRQALPHSTGSTKAPLRPFLRQSPKMVATSPTRSASTPRTSWKRYRHACPAGLRLRHHSSHQLPLHLAKDQVTLATPSTRALQASGISTPPNT